MDRRAHPFAQTAKGLGTLEFTIISGKGRPPAGQGLSNGERANRPAFIFELGIYCPTKGRPPATDGRFVAADQREGWAGGLRSYRGPPPPIYSRFSELLARRTVFTSGYAGNRLDG
jgi:hypothetical protein